MKKRTIAIIIALILLVSTLPLATAPVLAAPSVHNYTGDYSTNFNNPERGWHSDADHGSGMTNGVGGVNGAIYTANTMGYTLVRTLIRLDNWMNTDTLPSSLMTNVQACFNAFRSAGLKCHVRVVYNYNDGGNHASIDRIEKHAAQLGPLLEQNADVITHLEAGYIGFWGEWHRGNWFDFDSSIRKRVIAAILNATPNKDIKIAMRYVTHVRDIMNDNSFTQAQKDRIGHVNDSYMQSAGTGADWGTYEGFMSLGEARNYAYGLKTSQGFNKIQSGETEWSGQESHSSVLVDSYKLNLTSLNIAYNTNTHNSWRNNNANSSGNDPAQSPNDPSGDSVFQRLTRKMGYRLRLISATFDNNTSQGASYPFSMQIANDGYAGLINERPVFLVFDGPVRRNVPLNNTSFESRSWTGGDENKGPYNPSQTITVPSDLPNGSYTLALWMPDKADGLRGDARYSVRLANQSMWDNSKGYNTLGTVNVSGVPVSTTSGPIGQTTTTATGLVVTTTQGGGGGSFTKTVIIEDFNDVPRYKSSVNLVGTWINCDRDVVDGAMKYEGQWFGSQTSTFNFDSQFLVLSLKGTPSDFAKLTIKADNKELTTSTVINAGGFTEVGFNLAAAGVNSRNPGQIEILAYDSPYPLIYVNEIYLANAGSPATTAPPVTTRLTTTTTTRVTTTPNTGVPKYSVMRIDQLYAAVNGAKVKINDAEPLTPIFNDGGRTMVPFRFIATCFGAAVDWDGGAGSVIIDYKGKHIVMPIGASYAYVNGMYTPINAPAQIMTQYNRTFVPFRAVSDLLGDIYLDYDPGTATIVAADAPITGTYSLAYYVSLYNSIVK